MKIEKTNAMRILDKAKLTYQTYSYDAQDGAIDGVSPEFDSSSPHI